MRKIWFYLHVCAELFFYAVMYMAHVVDELWGCLCHQILWYCLFYYIFLWFTGFFNYYYMRPSIGALLATLWLLYWVKFIKEVLFFAMTLPRFEDFIMSMCAFMQRILLILLNFFFTIPFLSQIDTMCCAWIFLSSMSNAFGEKEREYLCFSLGFFFSLF